MGHYGRGAGALGLFGRRLIIKFLISLSAGVISCDACAESEQWPNQAEYPILKSVPTIFNDPPYGRGRVFSISNKAIFFIKREDLDEYLRDSSSIINLVKDKRIFELKRGHKLTALEEITSFRGRAEDQIFGRGYVMLISSF